MPSATKARCTTDAALTPATVTSVRRPPWTIELATISAFADLLDEHGVVQAGLK
jgi:hypothetical protein